MHYWPAMVPPAGACSRHAEDRVQARLPVADRPVSAAAAAAAGLNDSSTAVALLSGSWQRLARQTMTTTDPSR